jgi:ATP-dependent Lon protease
MRWLEAPSHDLAVQLQVIRGFLSKNDIAPEATVQGEVSREVRDIEPGSMTGGKVSSIELPGTSWSSGTLKRIFSEQELKVQISWAQGLAGDTKEVMLAHLKRARTLGAWRRVSVGMDEAALQGLANDFPNFSEVTEFVRKRLVLSQLTRGGPFRVPPLLLCGPPGTGKTAFSRRFASALGVPIKAVDVATLDTSFKLTGLDAGYATGRPGLVWDALQDECMSPVLLLDEIDKQPDATRDSGLGCLLGLLEPVTAKSYQDAAVQLAIDASHIYWIATCNDLDELDSPLLSRFRVIHIKPPEMDQIQAVARSIYREMRASEAWGMAFPDELSTEVLSALSDMSPRDIRQLLEDGCANAAANGRRAIQLQDLPCSRREKRRRVMGFLA